jgi:hypothetical protein
VLSLETFVLRSIVVEVETAEATKKLQEMIELHEHREVKPERNLEKENQLAINRY